MKMINYYSTEPAVFENFPRYDAQIKAIAQTFVKSNFKRLSDNKYQYKSKTTTSIHVIRIKDTNSSVGCSCTCNKFIKLAVCPNLVAFLNLN
jgi:hypothetical protein